MSENNQPNNKAPDYTVTANPHCMIHCGPLGPESKDSQMRDLTVVTSTDSTVVWGKNGNKEEQVTGTYTETSGWNIDPDQDDAISRAIVAKNGDIILTAESGNIRMRAKNIYMEAIAPDKDSDKHGNVNILGNGQITLSTGDEIRFACGNMCAVATKGFQFAGDFSHGGKFAVGGALDSASLIKAFTAGNWASIFEAIAKSCG